MTVVPPGTRADAGDRITYTVTVTNTGNQTLTAVSVADPRVANLDCDPLTAGNQTTGFTLAPGGTLTCIGSYTLTQADVTAGSVVNTATADSAETPPTDATATVPLTPVPGLALTKTGVLNMAVVPPDTRADAGDQIVYTLTATNTGNVPLSGVTVSDPKLPGLVCLPAVPVTLAPGASVTCTGTYTLTQADVTAGSVVNTATADSAETPPTDATATVPLTPVPGVGVDEDGRAEHGGRAAGHAGGRGRPDRVHVDGDEHRQRPVERGDGQRSEAAGACLPAGRAGHARPGRIGDLYRHVHADPGGRDRGLGREHGDR